MTHKLVTYPILRCAPDKPSLIRLLSKAPYNLTLIISSFTSYQGLNCFLASSSRFQLWPQSILSDVMGKPYPVLPPYFLLLGELLSIPQSPVQAALDISTVVMLSCILIFYHLFFTTGLCIPLLVTVSHSCFIFQFSAGVTASGLLAWLFCP